MEGLNDGRRLDVGKDVESATDGPCDGNKLAAGCTLGLELKLGCPVDGDSEGNPVGGLLTLGCADDGDSEGVPVGALVMLGGEEDRDGICDVRIVGVRVIVGWIDIGEVDGAFDGSDVLVKLGCREGGCDGTCDGCERMDGV